MQTKYKPFTAGQREQARQTDLVALLRSHGETLKRSGSEYVWREGAQKVTLRGNLWFHQYERVGGDAVDFARKFYGLDYPQAVEYLLGNGSTLTSVEKETPPLFQLPPRNDNLRRVFAYLVYRRGIDRDVFYTFIRRGMLYECADYHNAVFVGYDTGGYPRHAHRRGTGSDSTFKGNVAASDPRYSFHWSGQSELLFLFEAPIDLLSFVSLHKDGWQSHSYAAACCVGDQVLFQMLADNPKIRTVCLCMDNDAAGQAANRRIAEKLSKRNISVKLLVPSRKDWNEELLQGK